MKAYLAIAAAATLGTSAAAAPIFVTVDALANSSGGGVGAPSLALVAGQTFEVFVDADDLWSAGALPRWSNADGLIADLFATGSDESGEPAGTHIGRDFGTHSAFGHSAPFGALVGEIGGVYQTLGTSFSGAAWGTGILSLYYWDSNFADNEESVRVRLELVEAVPEPGALGLLGLGLLGLALAHRRRAS